MLTYKIVARHTGMHTPGLGGVLEQIQSFCLLNKLPPLSAIVVNKATGLPSEGFVATTNVPRALVEIFEAVPRVPMAQAIRCRDGRVAFQWIPAAAARAGSGEPSVV